LATLAAALLAAAGAHAKARLAWPVDDSMLTAKVKAELIKNPQTKARQIDVETPCRTCSSMLVDSAEAKKRGG